MKIPLGLVPINEVTKRIYVPSPHFQRLLSVYEGCLCVVKEEIFQTLLIVMRMSL